MKPRTTKINKHAAKPPGDPPMQADTTSEQQIITAGQRNINLMWETTQSRIALFVVIVGITINCLVVLMLLFTSRDITVNQLAVISIALQFINLTAGIVIGFYFSRTNHTAIGGIGPKVPGESR